MVLLPSDLRGSNDLATNTTNGLFRFAEAVLSAARVGTRLFQVFLGPARALLLVADVVVPPFAPRIFGPATCLFGEPAMLVLPLSHLLGEPLLRLELAAQHVLCNSRILLRAARVVGASPCDSFLRLALVLRASTRIVFSLLPPPLIFARL